jgi:hypothetical protein
MRRFSFQVETIHQAPNRPLPNLDAEGDQYRPVIMQIVPDMPEAGRSTFCHRLDRNGWNGARFH